MNRLTCFFATTVLVMAAQADTSESMLPEGVDSGGRWSAALEPGEDPRAVLLLDLETERVYQLGGDAQVTLEKVAWHSEDVLEIFGGGDSMSVEIAPPDPDDPEGTPLFRQHFGSVGSSTQASGFQSYGPRVSQGGGWNTPAMISYTKDRLKREGHRNRGPVVPKGD